MDLSLTLKDIVNDLQTKKLLEPFKFCMELYSCCANCTGNLRTKVVKKANLSRLVSHAYCDVSHLS